MAEYGIVHNITDYGKDLIQTDYDVGQMFPDDPKKGSSMGREVGIYGYKGRIPPSYIDYVSFPKDIHVEKEKFYLLQIHQEWQQTLITIPMAMMF